MRRIREAARHDEHLLLRTDLELDATQATKPV
jgi:hypothetical protein